MIATVSEQKTSCRIHNTGVSLALISNDRFLDHRKKMGTDSSLLMQWYRHHVYKHRRVPGDVKKLPVKKVLKRRVTCNYSPTNISNDEKSLWEGKAWHFPVIGWKYNERFLLKIPTRTKRRRWIEGVDQLSPGESCDSFSDLHASWHVWVHIRDTHYVLYITL